MRGIAWDGSLALGHTEIDRQHENLVGLINRLAAAWDEPDRDDARIARHMAGLGGRGPCPAPRQGVQGAMRARYSSAWSLRP